MYQPSHSLLHNTNPNIKLFTLFLFILICLFKYNYYILLGIVLLTLFNILLSTVHIKFYIRPVFKLLPLLLILMAILYRYQVPLILILVINLKIFAVQVYLLMIIYTTAPDFLASGIAKGITVFNFIGLNISKIEEGINNLLKKIIYSADAKNKLLISQMISKGTSTENNDFAKISFLFKNHKPIKKVINNSLDEYKIEKKYKLHGENKKRYKYYNGNKFIVASYVFIHLIIIVYYILEVR